MELIFDKVGERTFKTGVRRGVLSVLNVDGTYGPSTVFNGLTTVEISPTGGEENAQYADDIKYLSLTSAEEVAGTINCFMTPVEFNVCDGSLEAAPGVLVKQQVRRTFNLTFSERLGNDTQGVDYGEIITLLYNCKASPSSLSANTINDSPEAATLAYPFTTTPIPMPGNMKPAARIEINSTLVEPGLFEAFKELLYGTASTEAKFPTPAEVVEFFNVESNPTNNVATVTLTHTVDTINEDLIVTYGTTGANYLDYSLMLELADHADSNWTNLAHKTPENETFNIGPYEHTIDLTTLSSDYIHNDLVMVRAQAVDNETGSVLSTITLAFNVITHLPDETFDSITIENYSPAVEG